MRQPPCENQRKVFLSHLRAYRYLCVYICACMTCGACGVHVWLHPPHTFPFFIGTPCVSQIITVNCHDPNHDDVMTFLNYQLMGQRHLAP